MKKRIVYERSPTGKRFHEDRSFVRGLMGPIGSGKSVACCFEIFFIACSQAPNSDGVRRTRHAVIRNTYRELADTTIKTWSDWFGEELGEWKKADMTHVLSFPLKDGTKVEAEVLFRALDRPDDVKKLLSLELTSAWVNEAREVPRAVIDMLQGRVGRYPSKRDGGASWFGVFMDTNPPDEDSWWYRLFEEARPEGWRLFRQPSGVSPAAENLANLPDGYYTRMMAGKDPEWVKVYVHGEYGFVQDGRPVYPEFSDHVHVASEILTPVPGVPLLLGIDFGLTPAAVIGQRLGTGRWLELDELVSEDMGARRFGELLAAKLRGEFPGFPVEAWGDPAGEQRSQSDESTPYQMLAACGIQAIPTNTNDPTLRREAVARPMSTLLHDGKPAIIVSPKCRTLRKGLAGGYRYKRVQVAGDERFHDKPDKNQYSHVCDAQQYQMLGGGEGIALVTPHQAHTAPIQVDNHFSIF